MTLTLPLQTSLISYIGSGSYGDVSRCFSQKFNTDVAVKRISLGESGSIPATALREVSVLKHLQKQQIKGVENLVKLLDVQYDQKSLFLILELCDCDLDSKDIKVSPKLLAQQLLQGLSAIHSSECIHRDLKPSNILMKGDILKISDFGLARTVSVAGQTTSQVVSLWYRAPELALGAASYGAEIDCWSAGCCIYHFLTKRHLFEGISDQKTLLEHCCYLFGGYNSKKWPKSAQFDSIINSYEGAGVIEKELDKHKICKEAQEVILNLLELDGNKRFSAEQALQCRWFLE
ncbi:Kinase, CMGC CDK [Spironucleus salmonicida]|uniref:Kinase, CMGC CDK n=1 Tax=Spironucleus salmonicida TaxID=348837 RepID=V6LFG0_9EUKA|nr:Kinase, CMGC CDK [Spironucleus salmonicida]|eukprot:EST43227.1 Kinase, CMGC CDK [Spironucleus salmonicida]